MKKWSEIKEKIEGLDSYDCHPGNVADILRDLVVWLDEYFYGDWRDELPRPENRGPPKSTSKPVDLIKPRKREVEK